jgi:alpha-ketoglutarate-dependent taurine dioxygenase
MSLLAAFQILLARYTKQEDFVIGTDIAGRNRMETEGLIGFFVNLLVLRADLSGDPRFSELLGRVRERTLGAYAHQDVPYDKLVEELRPERTSSPTPLFQVLFVFQNTPRAILEKSGLTFETMKTDQGNSKFDLALFLAESEGVISGSWRYNTCLFAESTVSRLSGHFLTLLENIVKQPAARVSSLEIISETEKMEQTVEQKRRQAFNLQKLKSIKPKSINLPKGNLIKTSLWEPDASSLLIIEPELRNFDLVDWAGSNREFIETKLLEHGAILFRNFSVGEVSVFENLATVLSSGLFGEYGDLPREGVGGKVYGSTPYPSEQAILFHNESSHLHRWPLKIWFLCLKAPQAGGETPVVNCREIYQMLPREIRERFAEKKLMYVRNYTEGLDVSWRKFFQTDDRATVEEFCRKASMEFAWKPNGDLQTRQRCEAITKHVKTGEMVFFNQILLHHVSCLDAAVRRSMLALFNESDLPRNVYYGDGSPIEDAVVDEVRALYQRAAIGFQWQEGDILMLDNMLTAHGRNPYAGARKVVVALGEMIDKQGN